MNEIAIQARPAPLAVQSEAGSFLQVIAEAARDPSVDVAKMRELLAMRKELAEEEARQGFDAAMNAAQAEMEPVSKDASNPQTKSKYASYPALDRALRPIYTRHGFSLSFNTIEGAPADYIRVICDVSRTGHTRRYQLDMPADGKGAKGGDVMTKTHAAGSATRYGMRYLLTMIFNIATADDDGNRAGDTGGSITEKQREQIQTLIDETNSDIRRFCAAFGIEAVADLPAAMFPRAVQMLSAKKKAKPNG